MADPEQGSGFVSARRCCDRVCPTANAQGSVAGHGNIEGDSLSEQLHQRFLSRLFHHVDAPVRSRSSSLGPS